MILGTGVRGSASQTHSTWFLRVKWVLSPITYVTTGFNFSKSHLPSLSLGNITNTPGKIIVRIKCEVQGVEYKQAPSHCQQVV